MKKIIFYNPKEISPARIPQVPFSILTLASVLKDKYEILIIDGRVEYNPEKILIANIKESLFFGITAMTGSPIIDGLKMAAIARKHAPSVPIVWGGFHPTTVPYSTIAHPLVDILVVGQGELTIRELSDALFENKSLTNIRGVIYKKDGKVMTNEMRKFEDINGFAPIDYSLIDAKKYFKNDANSFTIDYLSSRGCPHNCKFCCITNVYGNKYYFYPANKVVSDVYDLSKKYGVNGIRFMDDDFFSNKKRVSDICEGFRNKIPDIKWWAMCRVDELLNIDDSLWGQLKSGGLKILNIGAESGSENTLNRIGKKIVPPMILKAAEICKKHKIQVYFSFMYGFFFETNKDIEQTLKTIDEMYKLNDMIDIGLFIHSPTPGTPLFDELIQNGYSADFKTLEEWGNGYDYALGNKEWLSQERKEFLESICFVVPFVFGAVTKRKLKLIQKLLYTIVSFYVGIRWRFKYFKWPYDLYLLRYVFRKISIKL